MGGGTSNSDSSQQSNPSDSRIGASDNAHVLQITGGFGNNANSTSTSGKPVRRSLFQDAAAQNATTAPATSPVTSGNLNYAESGAIAVTGAGNVVTVTDQGAVRAAISLAQDASAQVANLYSSSTDAQTQLVDKTLASLSNIYGANTPGGSQKTFVWLALGALGVVAYVLTKKSK